MISVLLDHNIRGYFDLLKGTLSNEESEARDVVQFILFSDVDLPDDSSDRMIWNFVQEKQILLLINNRNRKGVDSLQEAVETDISFESLGVRKMLAQALAGTQRERALQRPFPLAGAGLEPRAGEKSKIRVRPPSGNLDGGDGDHDGLDASEVLRRKGARFPARARRAGLHNPKPEAGSRKPEAGDPIKTPFPSAKRFPCPPWRRSPGSIGRRRSARP